MRRPSRHTRNLSNRPPLFSHAPDRWIVDMIVCVESYIGEKGGREGVKLEQPVWITDAGPVVLSDDPLEDDYG